MKRNKKKNNRSCGLYIVMVIIVLITGLGALRFTTNGVADSIQPFYLTRNNKAIISNLNNYKFPSNQEIKFNIVNPISYLDWIDNTRFEISITPNVDNDNDFEYLVDNEVHLFSELEDLEETFNLDLQEKYFSIQSTFIIEDILAEIYPDSEVVIIDEINRDVDYFTLKVNEVSLGNQINISFRLNNFIREIEFDKSEVLF